MYTKPLLAVCAKGKPKCWPNHYSLCVPKQSQYVDQTNITAIIILPLTKTSEIAIPKAQQQRYLTRPKTQQVFNYPTTPWICCNAKMLFIKITVQHNIFHYLDITFLIHPTNSTATDIPSSPTKQFIRCDAKILDQTKITAQ